MRNDTFEILDGDMLATPNGLYVAVLTHTCGMYKMVWMNDRSTEGQKPPIIDTSYGWIARFDGNYGDVWELYRKCPVVDKVISYKVVKRKRDTVGDIKAAFEAGNMFLVNDLLQVLYSEGFTDGLNSRKDKQ